MFTSCPDSVGISMSNKMRSGKCPLDNMSPRARSPLEECTTLNPSDSKNSWRMTCLPRIELSPLWCRIGKNNGQLERSDRHWRRAIRIDWDTIVNDAAWNTSCSCIFLSCRIDSGPIYLDHGNSFRLHNSWLQTKQHYTNCRSINPTNVGDFFFILVLCLLYYFIPLNLFRCADPKGSWWGAENLQRVEFPDKN